MLQPHSAIVQGITSLRNDHKHVARHWICLPIFRYQGINHGSCEKMRKTRISGKCSPNCINPRRMGTVSPAISSNAQSPLQLGKLSLPSACAYPLLVPVLVSGGNFGNAMRKKRGVTILLSLWGVPEMGVPPNHQF